LNALLARLGASVDVQNPVQSGAWFTSLDRRKRELERLREMVAEKLLRLGILHQSTCTPAQAYAAWDAIFWHDYWSGTRKAVAQSAAATGLSRNTIRRWLREPSTGEPKYAKRVNNSVVDPWSDQQLAPHRRLQHCRRDARHFR
jgi:hypothetical protein